MKVLRQHKFSNVIDLRINEFNDNVQKELRNVQNKMNNSKPLDHKDTLLLLGTSFICLN